MLPAAHHGGTDIAGPAAGFCIGRLTFGGGGALAANYRGAAVVYARRAEQSARAVGLGRNRLPARWTTTTESSSPAS